MYTLHCTKKLRDRTKLPVASTAQPPTTRLGNWYATALFWKPQVALLVNERTLLPVFMPLAPIATWPARFAHQLAIVLTRHGADRPFIANEIDAMREIALAKTANRSVVGTMNEFVFLAEGYREDQQTADLLPLSMRLAGTPCSAIGHDSPERLIQQIIGASTH